MTPTSMARTTKSRNSPPKLSAHQTLGAHCNPTLAHAHLEQTYKAIMERIKIVQVGRTHEHANGKINTIKKMPDIFEIVGIVDDRNDVHTPSFPSDQSCFDGLPMITMDQALNWPGLQAACIEVPNNQLVETTIPFAERGLAIHMDKPAGTSLADFRKLLDICKAKNLPFQMGYMFRGNPAMTMAAECVQKGWIGDVFEIQCDMSHNYGGDSYQEYLGQMKGGIVYNLLCHLIDYITPWMGRPENIVSILTEHKHFDTSYVRMSF